jgi:hypothetical protein
MAYWFIPVLLFALALFLIQISGQMGKRTRLRSIPRGTAPRPRSREEIMHELRTGQVALDNAIRATEEGFFRTRLELDKAKQGLEAAMGEVSHAA